MSTKPPQKHACTCGCSDCPLLGGAGWGDPPRESLVSPTAERREELLDIKRYFLYYITAFVNSHHPGHI